MKTQSLGLVAGAIVASTVPLLFADSAKADLDICNETNTNQWTAIGYPALGRWWAQGWFIVAPNRCATVVHGNLKNRFYYIHAHSPSDSRDWEGRNHPFCVSNQPFKLQNISKCSEGTLNFRQIDVGNSFSYRHRICPISGCKPIRPSGTYQGDTE